jgi:hypothetical protein
VRRGSRFSDSGSNEIETSQTSLRGFLKKAWRQRQSSVHSSSASSEIGEALLHVDLYPKERLVMPTRKKAGKSGAKKKVTKKKAAKKSVSSRKRGTAKQSAARKTTKKSVARKTTRKRSSPAVLKKAKQVLKAVVVGAAAGAAQGAVKGAAQEGSKAAGLGTTEEGTKQLSDEGRKHETEP